MRRMDRHKTKNRIHMKRVRVMMMVLENLKIPLPTMERGRNTLRVQVWTTRK